MARICCTRGNDIDRTRHLIHEGLGEAAMAVEDGLAVFDEVDAAAFHLADFEGRFQQGIEHLVEGAAGIHGDHQLTELLADVHAPHLGFPVALLADAQGLFRASARR